MEQAYQKYTQEDQVMWQMLYQRQMAQLPAIASRMYLEGIEKVGFRAEHIPNFNNETNPRLRQLTGWEVEVVPGLIPQADFFRLLSNRKFPASTWLRTPAQLDYLEEPDMFHDTFGHVPLLTHQPFCDFVEDLSRIALRFIDLPEAIVQISRLYWYTVEFGLIEEAGQLKIYGGGILSSAGESVYCLNDKIPKLPFDVRTILATPFHIDRFQEHYFVINSYEQLYRSTPDIEEFLSESYMVEK